MTLPLLGLVVIGYLIVYSIRQVWFHPLSRYPGPKLAALTKWYKGYYDLIIGGGMLENIKELHKRHGPVVRIGPNELHFSSSRAYHQIYAPGSRYAKEPFFYHGFGVDESGFGELEPEPAKARRDMLSPLFSRRAILKLEQVVQEKVDLLVSQLAEYNSRPADLHLASRCVSFDIIAAYCFASSFDALTTPGFKHPMLVSFDKVISHLWFTRYFPIIHSLAAFAGKWFGDNEFIVGHATIQKKVSSQVDLFLENESALDNLDQEILYHHLLRPQSEKIRQKRLTRKQLLDEGQVLLMAGSDTVANTLVWGVFRVLWDKHIYNKLLSELQEAWPDKDKPMPYTSLEKLPYLTAVIKETLRLMGGVITPLPRVVTLDVSIDDHPVPKGTIVSTGSTFLHHDPTIFADPFEFIPDRWLQPTSNKLENYLVPFSRGPRMCLGVNLAWCELYLLFGNVFRKLDMELYQTDLSDFQYKELFVTILTGRRPQVTVHKKQD